MALTCYHVIASQDGATKGAFNKDVDGKYGPPILVQSPAELDVNESVKHRHKALANDPRLRKAKSALAALTKRDFSMGKVIAALSVTITKHGRRMDWALIATKGPMPKNKPPPLSAFDGQHSIAYPDGSPFSYSVTKDSRVRQFGTLREDQWVVKVVRTSGYVRDGE